MTQADNDASVAMKKITSALFYAISSFMITVVNKIVLTSFKFPSYQFVGLGQVAATILILGVSKQAGFLKFPSFERSLFTKIWPLPVIFLGNMITGLGGTKELSLPMFTVLRRFSILMTMIAERIVLGVKAAFAVKVSVYSMVGGAIIASLDDLSFTVSGYTLMFLNDIFTATNGVYMKKKLDAKELGKYGLLYYNALFVFVPVLVCAWLTGDIDRTIAFEGWNDFLFIIFFSLSCIMGFVLSYGVMICTQYNSALTTTIIGCLKNICVTYLGMVIGGDYVFSWINFIGLNISVLGSLLYSYVTFRKRDSEVSLITKDTAKGEIV